ncbi:MAG: chromate transporter [Clostridia bacterium]|nr:chromate transporter [Clostridia bacterium]
MKNNIKEYIRNYLKIIYVFFIIGLESLGNMSAVSAILEENLVKKHKMVEQDDIIDSVTMARLGPGAITANAVAYLGNKIAGFLGGIIAGISYTIAPLIIFLVIYGFLDKVLELRFVQSALNGCLIYICVIFLETIYQMGKSILQDKLNIVLFTLAIIIELTFNLPCMYIIISAVIIGLIKIFVFQKGEQQLLPPCDKKII